MLNIGGWELMIILLVALVFLGPERLPGVARQVGQFVTTLRGLARDFQTELESAARPDPITPATTPEPVTVEKANASTATDVDELAAQAREVSAENAAIAPVNSGGPENLSQVVLDEEPTTDGAPTADENGEEE